MISCQIDPNCVIIKGMGQNTNLVDRRFGRWLVISFAGRNQHHKKMWNCVCDCGTVRAVCGGDLVSGQSKSCGCLKEELRYRTHGHSAGGKISDTYTCWQNMKRRCLDPQNSGYKDYGGRGIKVCPRWFESFDNFLFDMGEKPEGLTLERRAVNGNYEPSNCRWATSAEQAQNTRKTKLTPANIIEMRLRAASGGHFRALALEYGISAETAHKIITGRTWKNIPHANPTLYSASGIGQFLRAARIKRAVVKSEDES